MNPRLALIKLITSYLFLVGIICSGQDSIVNRKLIQRTKILQISSPKKAIVTYDSIIRSIKPQDAPEYYFEVLLGRAQTLTNIGKNETALNAFDEVIKHAQKYTNEQQLAQAYFTKGESAQKYYYYQIALYNYEQALNIFDKSKNHAGKLKTYKNLGVLKMEISEFSEAQSLLSTARELAELLKDNVQFVDISLLECECKNNLEETILKETTDAYFCYKTTLNFIEERNLGQLKNISLAKAYIGILESSRNLNIENIDQEVIDFLPNVMSEQFKGIDIKIEYLNTLMGTLLDKGNATQAKKYSDEIERLLENEKKKYYPFLENKARLLALQGKYKRALELKEEYFAVEDSIQNFLRDQQIKELTSLSEIEKRNKERLNYQYAAEKKERIKIRENNQLNLVFLLSLLGLLGLIIYFFFRSSKEEIKLKKLQKFKKDLIENRLNEQMENEESERQRISHILHEEVNSELAALKYKLSSMGNTHIDKDNLHKLNSSIELLDRSIDKVRLLTTGLTASQLQQVPFLEATTNFINHVKTEFKAEVDFHSYGDEQNFPNIANLNIIRILKELLYNAIEHAQSSQIMVQIYFQETELSINIEDDGIGFEPNQFNFGIGLQNTKRRIDYLGGNWDIVSDDEGTSITVALPYNELRTV